MIDWTVHHVHSNLSYFIYFHNSSISCCTATAVFSSTNNSLKQGDKSLQPHQLLHSLQKQSVLEKCREHECDITLYCMLGQWLNFVMKSSCYLTHYRFTAYLCFAWLKSLLIQSKSKPVSKKAEQGIVCAPWQHPKVSEGAYLMQMTWGLMAFWGFHDMLKMSHTYIAVTYLSVLLSKLKLNTDKVLFPPTWQYNLSMLNRNGWRHDFTGLSFSASRWRIYFRFYNPVLACQVNINSHSLLTSTLHETAFKFYFSYSGRAE